MSKFYVPDVAEEAWLDRMTANNITLKLFENDVLALGSTPINDAAIAALDHTDFTEATFTGYSAVTLTGGSWTTTQADPSTATYAQQTFTSSAAQSKTVWGYYLISTTGGTLLGFRQRDLTKQYSITANGQTLKITPKLFFKMDGTNTVDS